MPAQLVRDAMTSADAARSAPTGEILVERSNRLVSLAHWVQSSEHFNGVACSRAAVEAAARFADTWIYVEFPDATSGLAAMLDPIKENRMIASADCLATAQRGRLDPTTLELAAAALRCCADRASKMPEAQVVAEAVNLDSIGAFWLTAQIARCNQIGRPFRDIIQLWRRHEEYHYWDRRIAESLRFEPSRRLARQRLAELAQCIAILERHLGESVAIGSEAH